MTTTVEPAARHLTHVELLYRPGERALAAKLLALLGCEPADRGGIWFTSFVASTGPRDYANNVLYASEITEDQWQLEQALTQNCAEAHFRYTSFLRREPQRSPHFGFSVPDQASLDALVERVTTAGSDDPDLAGRVAVDGVYRPGEPGSIAPNMVQAFVWTDVVASGLLSLGQHIEVQLHLTDG